MTSSYYRRASGSSTGVRMKNRKNHKKYKLHFFLLHLYDRHYFSNSPHCNHDDQVYDMSSYVAVAGTPQVEKPNLYVYWVFCILYFVYWVFRILYFVYWVFRILYFVYWVFRNRILGENVVFGVFCEFSILRIVNSLRQTPPVKTKKFLFFIIH